ncbi:CRISPR-associated protein Cas7/Cst2/DevR, subtype I-B/TNEAP [Aciduliprofundum sp. MAR08-339]|uniref:type I-B CRISPR-associated protein Cas7/Cst2/DevR n=1 Tax=Aciduliprofundum sp. (strain MAR08-339) TaxID=673860 RepID=UPI0002A4912F|nr:CRISPR-associated protein Cas7/Cst2/DevR, subtype I-B/TNEAP [Aciduliprofundum sp. MAR08-339]
MRKITIGILSRVSGNVNANEVDGDRIRIKKMVSTSGEVYPFVSARAIKRGIREKLSEYGFEVDPFRSGEGNKLADSGDPIKYVDNDLFGYLYIKGNKQIPRVAPISMSPLIAVEHTPIKTDFGGRFPKTPGESNPTPFEIEVADFVGLLKVVITERSGIFISSEKTDKERSWKEYYKEGLLEQIEEDTFKLPDDERIYRVKAFLKILLKEGWAYPRRTNNLAMAEHNSVIIYAGSKLYPVWKLIDKENYTFKVPEFSDDTKKLLKVYNYPEEEISEEDIETLATWLVSGTWKKGD